MGNSQNHKNWIFAISPIIVLLFVNSCTLNATPEPTPVAKAITTESAPATPTIQPSKTPIPTNTSNSTPIPIPTATPAMIEVIAPIVAVKECPIPRCAVVDTVGNGTNLTVIAHNGDKADPWFQVETSNGSRGWLVAGADRLMYQDDLWDQLAEAEYSIPIWEVLIHLNNEDSVALRHMVGRTPFTVDISADVSGGTGDLEYSWDFDGDGIADSTEIKPNPVTFDSSGIYLTTLVVSDSIGQVLTTTQRIVSFDKLSTEVARKRADGILGSVNLGNPDIVGFDEAEELISEYNRLGTIAFRLGLNNIPQQRRRYRDFFNNINHAIIITPNYIHTPPGIHEYMEHFGDLVRDIGLDKVLYFEIGNEINLVHQLFSPEVAVSYIIQSYLELKAITPEIPVLFPSFTNGPWVDDLGGMDPYEQLTAILAYEDGKVCQYFDGISMHPSSSVPIDYGESWNRALFEFINQHDRWLDIFEQYCEYEYFVVETELGPPFHYQIEWLFSDRIEWAIDFYTEWLTHLVIAAYDQKGVVFVGSHDWEFAPGYPYSTRILSGMFVNLSSLE